MADELRLVITDSDEDCDMLIELFSLRRNTLTTAAHHCDRNGLSRHARQMRKEANLLRDWTVAINEQFPDPPLEHPLVREADPELERLLAEEEEIERRTRQATRYAEYLNHNGPGLDFDEWVTAGEPISVPLLHIAPGVSAEPPDHHDEWDVAAYGAMDTPPSEENTSDLLNETRGWDSSGYMQYRQTFIIVNGGRVEDCLDYTSWYTHTHNSPPPAA